MVGRRLYDNGRLVSESPVLTRVRRPFLLHVNPQDVARLGVEAGAEVKVTSTRGSRVVAIEPDAGVPARRRALRLLRRRHRRRPS